MTRYIVFEPAEDRSERAIFLRDGFSWLAFLLPFIWLARHRLFMAAGLAFAIQGGLILIGRIEGFGLAALVLCVLFGAGAALEGPRLVAFYYHRRSFREAALIQASDSAEAELAYYGPDMALAAKVDPSQAAPADAAIRLRSDTLWFGWRRARTLLDTGGR